MLACHWCQQGLTGDLSSMRKHSWDNSSGKRPDPDKIYIPLLYKWNGLRFYCFYTKYLVGVFSSFIIALTWVLIIFITCRRKELSFEWPAPTSVFMVRIKKHVSCQKFILANISTGLLSTKFWGLQPLNLQHVACSHLPHDANKSFSTKSKP